MEKLIDTSCTMRYLLFFPFIPLSSLYECSIRLIWCHVALLFVCAGLLEVNYLKTLSLVSSTVRLMQGNIGSHYFSYETCFVLSIFHDRFFYCKSCIVIVSVCRENYRPAGLDPVMERS